MAIIPTSWSWGGWHHRTMAFGGVIAVFARQGLLSAIWCHGRFLTFTGLVFAFLWVTSSAKSDVQIAGLSDLDLGTWGGIGDLTGDISHCVLDTAPAPKISIEASGDGPGGTFALLNGASILPFQVSHNDGGGFVPMTPQTPLANRKALNSKQFTRCLNGSRAPLLIRVLILEADLSLASGGTYAGLIYLTVVPE